MDKATIQELKSILQYDAFRFLLPACFNQFCKTSVREILREIASTESKEEVLSTRK